MADKKVSELIALNTLSGDDLLLVVNDPAGTPSSRKISVGNVFGNVAVETTHKAKTTFTANVVINTNRVTATANVAVTGDLSVNGYSVLTELDSKQSAASSAADLANTNLAIADRIQVANAAATYASLSGATFTGSLETLQSFRANTMFVQSNAGLVLTTTADPSSNNPSTEGWGPGTMAFSNTYLYIAVDGNTIKRVPLEVF